MSEANAFYLQSIIPVMFFKPAAFQNPICMTGLQHSHPAISAHEEGSEDRASIPSLLILAGYLQISLGLALRATS